MAKKQQGKNGSWAVVMWLLEWHFVNICFVKSLSYASWEPKNNFHTLCCVFSAAFLSHERRVYYLSFKREPMQLCQLLGSVARSFETFWFWISVYNHGDCWNDDHRWLGNPLPSVSLWKVVQLWRRPTWESFVANQSELWGPVSIIRGSLVEWINVLIYCFKFLEDVVLECVFWRIVIQFSDSHSFYLSGEGTTWQGV